VSLGGAHDDDIGIVEERLREARDAFRQGDRGDAAAPIRRGERGVGEWVASLRAIGTGANADMRTAPVPRENLFRIVEDPAAVATDRAAAAIALGAELDDESRARLRRTAESTAALRLRVAFERAAGDGETAEIEAALAELDGEEGQRRAKS
jgi:hypothetical protein